MARATSDCMTLGAHAVERVPRAADLVLARREVGAQRDHALVERAHFAACSSSSTRTSSSSSALGLLDRLAQLVAPAARCASMSARRAGDARFELARGFVEPHDVGVERRGALDQRRLLGARFGDAAACGLPPPRAPAAAGPMTSPSRSLGAALLRSRASRSRRPLPRGAARPSALLPRRGGARCATTSSRRVERAQLVGGAASCASRADDRLFVLVLRGDGRRERRFARRRWRRRATRPRASCGRARRPRRPPARAARSASPRVSRMPRASWRDPPSTRPRAAKHFARHRRDRHRHARRQRGARRRTTSTISASPMSRDSASRVRAGRARDARQRCGRAGGTATATRRRRGSRHRRARRSRSGRRSCSAASASARSTSLVRSTMTCWSRSPSSASTARSNERSTSR